MSERVLCCAGTSVSGPRYAGRLPAGNNDDSAISAFFAGVHAGVRSRMLCAGTRRRSSSVRHRTSLERAVGVSNASSKTCEQAHGMLRCCVDARAALAQRMPGRLRPSRRADGVRHAFTSGVCYHNAAKNIKNRLCAATSAGRAGARGARRGAPNLKNWPNETMTTAKTRMTKAHRPNKAAAPRRSKKVYE
jgi:hypothetical protein